MILGKDSEGRRGLKNEVVGKWVGGKEGGRVGVRFSLPPAVFIIGVNGILFKNEGGENSRF